LEDKSAQQSEHIIQLKEIITVSFSELYTSLGETNGWVTGVQEQVTELEISGWVLQTQLVEIKERSPHERG
jgi:hypothetical protein